MRVKKIEEFCPVRDIMTQFGDKWSVLILLSLENVECLRFGELAKTIPDISQKMLTTTLRTLESLNFINRTIYPEIPPRVEYSLTETGKSLMPHIHGLIDWILEYKETCLEAQ
ncbi:MAG: winged helix-turn-helix transcriptional regulator [Marinifilaceae bacterium]